MKLDDNVSIRALVVEDEPDYADLLASLLREEGCRVETATDGIEALARVHVEPPDVITLDMQMPRKGGVQFYRELKSDPALREIPVVVVTGLTVDDQDMENFIHTFLDVEHLPMPDAYLEKPVEADQFCRVVRDSLRTTDSGSQRSPIQEVGYAMVRNLPSCDYEEAVRQTTALLGDEGFGVITEIDVKETLKKKLDLDFQRYVILGACNPALAHKALTHEPFIGVLLPCNLVVMDRAGGGSTVVAFDPTAAFGLVENEAIGPLGGEVKAALTRVLRGIDS